MHPKQLVRVAVLAALMVLAVAAGYYAVGWFAQSNQKPLRPLHAVLPRERLAYDVYFGDVKAGTFTVEVSGLIERPGASPVYRVNYHVRTERSIGSLYSVDGQMTALLDAATLLPVEYEEEFRKGTWVKQKRRHRKYVYDRAAGLLRYFKARHGKGPLLHQRDRNIPPKAQHYMSLLYSVRRAGLTPGRDFIVTVSDRKADLTFRFTVAREENYTPPSGGIRRAMVVKASIEWNAQQKKETDPPEWLARAELWLDKAEGFPVRLDAPTEWGTITATLTERTVAGAASSPQ